LLSQAGSDFEHKLLSSFGFLPLGLIMLSNNSPVGSGALL
jgi:hypothetical protein